MQGAPLVLPQDEHNKTLLQNVHPADWKNPKPSGAYNLVVIGAGTAGLVTAAGAAGLGAKVALVERHLLGGDCLNVGCVPSKALISAGRAMSAVKRAGSFGVVIKNTGSLDFSRAMERMRRLRAGISFHDSVQRFSGLGVDVFLGEAKFVDARTIMVNDTLLRFKKAVICTGARAAVPDISGLETAGYFTNETIFELTKLPLRLAVIGGGPIGCELAQAFARLGSNVTLFQQGSQLLPRDDKDAAKLIYNSLLADGVEVILDARIRSVFNNGKEKLIRGDGFDKRGEIAADEILVAAGRVPNVEDLALDKAGIVFDSKSGVQVNDFLQTSNSRVYAAGDICSRYQFTHAADAMARIVIANSLFMQRQRASKLIVPWCTYTDPEVAHVGITEKEVISRAADVQTVTTSLSDVDRAVLDGEEEGYVRIHLKNGSDLILGATIVARHAGEMINEITLAMTSGLGLSAIGKTIHPYPTQAEAIKKTADAFNKTRLTPFIKKLMSAWMKWQRS